MRLVLRHLGFDVGIGFSGSVPTTGMPAPAAPASAASMGIGIGLIANAFANTLRLFDEVIKETPDIVRHVVDDGEDFFEHVPNEVRSGDSKIVCEVSDFLGELFRDPGVENAFFAPMVTTAVAP